MPIKADKSLRAYYNEIDPFAAQWIRNLMAEGWITKGDVDERSIEDVQPNDIAGYDRLHFFAGVAVWDYALNQAGWGRGEIWTGSCPCQPFSAAGKGVGFDDERHLWPAFHHLIKECKPATVIGEQVASKDADSWIDLVHTDMEALGYAFGAVAFPSASVGAPHIRDRCYWAAGVTMGDASSKGPERHARNGGPEEWKRSFRPTTSTSISGRVADNDSNGCQSGGKGCEATGHGKAVGPDCGVGRVEHSEGNGWEQWGSEPSRRGIYSGCTPSGMADNTQSDGHKRTRELSEPTGGNGTAHGSTTIQRTGPVNGFWRAADWLGCRDGKWRPVEPGTFPLVNGASARVVRLRAYGNAINAVQAQTFIESVMEAA